MAKLTFTLDEQTARTIRALAERQRKPQSRIVREAISVYAAQDQQLTQQERDQKLEVIDRLMATRPTRRAQEVDAELRQLSRQRRAGWRRRSD